MLTICIVVFAMQIRIVLRWNYLHVLKLVECKTFHDNTCGNKSLDVWINGFLCSFAILINCTNPFVFKTIWKMLNRIFWVTNRNCQTNNKITREAIITLEQYTFRRVLTYVFSTILWYLWRFLYDIWYAITLPRKLSARIHIEYNMEKETLFPWVIKFTRS